ncbi:MAG: hypothetical protein RXR31_04540 [Thermoproteota archaeon]|jgi:hypothetical protein
MRKVIKKRRGDISGPIVAVLLIIASIAIASVVITWMYSLGTSASKQGALLVVGTPVIAKNGNNYTLYITVKNSGNVPVNVTGVIVNGVPWTIISNTPNLVTVGVGAVVSFSASYSTSITLNTNVNGVLQTTAGTIPFVAIVQS